MTTASAVRDFPDSDIAVSILWNRETVVARVGEVGPDQVVIASMTEGELPRPPMGERDLIIASVAVASGLTLVSANAGEFRRVSGLVVENWAA